MSEVVGAEWASMSKDAFADLRDAATEFKLNVKRISERMASWSSLISCLGLRVEIRAVIEEGEDVYTYDIDRLGVGDQPEHCGVFIIEGSTPGGYSVVDPQLVPVSKVINSACFMVAGVARDLEKALIESLKEMNESFKEILT